MVDRPLSDGSLPMKSLLPSLVCVFLLSAAAPSHAFDISAGDTATGDDYATLRIAELGLSRTVYNLALKGFKKLAAEKKLHNPDVVTIIDYSQSSNQKRLYVLDLKHKKVLFNTYVAHGRKTGEEFAQSFSNCNGSYQSSLGFFVTRQTLVGSHTGFALSLDGVEKGFNDNANRRAIIMHAADYVSESFIKKYGRLGRSLGCPALPPELNTPIIEAIKGGTCLFQYNADPGYLCASALLN